METPKTISLAPFFDGSAEARRRVADEVASVYAERRWFRVCDHGVPDGLVTRVEVEARAFFAQPIESKLPYLAVTGCGYLPSPGLIGMPEFERLPQRALPRASRSRAESMAKDARAFRRHRRGLQCCG